jgi:predicted transcriptional regulator
MRFIHQRITIIRTRTPSRKNLNEELQWLGSSLGLFNIRDRDRSCFRIFIELLKSAKKEESMTSDEIADMLHLTRATVIHHLHKLMESGIVLHEGKRYRLRVNNLSQLIDELEKDIKRTCDDLKKIAADIDEELGL